MFSYADTYAGIYRGLRPALVRIAEREFEAIAGTYADGVPFDREDEREIHAAAEEMKRLLCVIVDAEAAKAVLYGRACGKTARMETKIEAETQRRQRRRRALERRLPERLRTFLIDGR